MVTLSSLDESHGVTFGATDIADFTPLTRQGDRWFKAGGIEVEVSAEQVVVQAWVSPDRTLAVFIDDHGCGDSCYSDAVLVDASGKTQKLSARPSVVAWHPSSSEVAIDSVNEDGLVVEVFTVSGTRGADLATLTSTFEDSDSPNYRPDGTLLVKRKNKTFARSASGTLERT